MPDAKHTVGCKRCGKTIPVYGRSRLAIHCPCCGFTFRAESPSPARPTGSPTPPQEAPEPTGSELTLRRDLIIEPVEEEGAVYYVIKDPLTLKYFRVKPLEHFLITQFDGKTPFDEIRRRASEQQRVLIGPDVLSKFADKFIDLGLLQSPDRPLPLAMKTHRTGRSWLSRVLYLKIPLVNPERVLDRLYPKVRWLLRPTPVAAMAVAILFAAGLAVLHRESLAFGLAGIANLEGLFLIYVTISVVTVFHELAHAITCRHFGGNVQDMGVLLLYFVPCFYCNVSDTYLFKEKRQRLWVTFSGGFFELTIWALAVIGWRLVTPEVFLSRVLFIVIAVCGVKSLFNFNPLIKLDGYYMLADTLGIANLRKEALSGVGRFLKRRVLGLPIEPPRPELAARSILAMRGDRFLALFGATALAYTLLLLGYVVFWSGGRVFEAFGPSGLGFFTFAMLGLLHKPAAAAMSSARVLGKEKWEQLGTVRRRFRFLAIWVVVLVVVAVFPWQLRIRSDLTVLPQARVMVRAPADGRIERIFFQEGERVRKDDLLLEYDTKALILEKETKQAEIARAREELRLLGKVSPTWQEEIRVQERALETARAREKAALQEFERAQQLWSAGLMPRGKFDEAQSTFQQAESERRRQEAQVQLVQKASRTSRNEQMEMLHLRDPEAQQAVIHRLEAEIGRLDDLLSRSKIHTPIPGTLTTYRFQEKLGEFLEEGDIVCEVVDDEKVVIEMPVPEKEIDVIRLGYPVKFKVRGYPGRSFEASVAEIAPVATQGEKVATILIRATLGNEERLLKPGMTGVAKVYCGRTIVAHVLIRDLVRFIRTEFWL